MMMMMETIPLALATLVVMLIGAYVMLRSRPPGVIEAEELSGSSSGTAAADLHLGAAEVKQPEPPVHGFSAAAAAAAPPAASYGQGAAEEPGPSSYDPHQYQPPHPDDRGGIGKAAKKGGKSKGKGKANGMAKDNEAMHRCGNCDAPDAKSKCNGCGVERYCGKECQAEHWKYGGHKKACPAYVVAAAAQAQQDRLCKKAFEADKCLICLESPREPTTLPCGHAFCTACVVELRAKGVSETCPLCRSPLPPGPEKLFELGYRVWAKLSSAMATAGAINRDPWHLSASQQGEMDGAIVMLQEAMDQGHIGAATLVGSLYHWGHGVAIDDPRAMAALKVGAEEGDAACQYLVGSMYYNGLGVDVDYAQARPWIEKAAAQDYFTAVGVCDLG